jgi:RNA polymerase sigma-70 factor (family 1)
MLNFREDETAFRAFVTEYRQQVFNVILNRVQHLQDAEDITQDVFTDVYHKSDAFRGEAAISTWLYRIAINKCIDHLRRKQRRANSGLFGLFNKDSSNEEAGTDFNHPGMAMENKEKGAILFKAIKKLPEKQYTAWILSEIQNLSYKEIAEIMKVSLSSVESLLFRARQNLRKIIAGMYPGEK